MSEEDSGVQRKPKPFSGPSPSGTPEQRSPETLPSDVTTVFQQEDPTQPSRHLTPEAAGITVNTRPGQVSDRREVGSQEHSIGPASEAYTNEPRVKVNPARKGGDTALSYVTSGDIFNKDLNMNPAFVKYAPLSKKRITTADCRECLGCGWCQTLDNSKCEKCGSHGLRLVKKDSAVYPPEKGAVAHLTRTVQNCWNSFIDPESGDSTQHRLVEKLQPVVDIQLAEWHQERQCKTCGAVYGYANGRQASNEELELARQGKLPPPTREKSLIMTGGRS